ncbi:hypothetical protein B9Z55_024271 [Caenorhabditis nigoni]|nr:hypothetical protein B9Z55_024271 [Caenorhabditis nigoni]
MPSLGHKEEVATFHRLQTKDSLPPRFRSARFERLRGAPDPIKPVFVNPASLESEEPLNPTPPAPIEVVPSSESFTEIPSDFVQTSETPSPLSFTEFNIESLPIFKDTDEPVHAFGVPTTQVILTTSEEPLPTTDTTVSQPAITEASTEPTTPEPSTFESIPTELVVTPSEIPSPPPSSTEQTSDVSRGTPAVHEYAQERIFPTMVSVKPSIASIEVLPSHQIEVGSTNAVEETLPITSTKAPRKRRHRRKHRKLRKVTKATDAPTEAPTEITTVIETVTEPSTETSTEASTTPSTTTPPPTHSNTFPTSGSTGAKIGESYLGGWNEDEGVIVTTSGPSLGSAINQFSEIPASISIDDDKAIKEYYEKYYAEWYQQHNQAINTPGGILPTTSAAVPPREIKIELAKPTSSPSFVAPQPTAYPSAAEPTKEQLDKVCDYVAKISKSFGIKDLVGFAKNNCAFVKSFHPTATCEQIQHLMSYCVTGVYVQQ